MFEIDKKPNILIFFRNLFEKIGVKGDTEKNAAENPATKNDSTNKKAKKHKVCIQIEFFDLNGASLVLMVQTPEI